MDCLHLKPKTACRATPTGCRHSTSHARSKPWKRRASSWPWPRDLCCTRSKQDRTCPRHIEPRGGMTLTERGRLSEFARIMLPGGSGVSGADQLQLSDRPVDRVLDTDPVTLEPERNPQTGNAISPVMAAAFRFEPRQAAACKAFRYVTAMRVLRGSDHPYPNTPTTPRAISRSSSARITHSPTRAPS